MKIHRVPCSDRVLMCSKIGNCIVFRVPLPIRGTRRTRQFRAEIEDQRPRASVNVFQCGCPRDPASSPTVLAAGEVRPVRRQGLSSGDRRRLPEVPVEVEANICTTWADK
jgi:hypothetical protein